ncbi:MAG: molecular chaperone HtpG, partial [Candidatus Marinamargulisbacteria bacterium]
EFYEKVKDIVIFKSTSGATTSIPDYLERNKAVKENQVVYCVDKEGQASYVSMCKDQGLEVIFFDSSIDAHFIQFLESKDDKVKYVSVDSDLSDQLIDKDKESTIVDPADNKTAGQKVVDIFKNILKDDKLTIKAEHLKSGDVSAVLLLSEQSRRFKQMSAMMQGAKMPGLEDFTLVINTNSPVIDNILSLSKARADSDKIGPLCNQVYDLAKLSQSPLSGDQMNAFIKRSNQLLGEITENGPISE